MSLLDLLGAQQARRDSLGGFAGLAGLQQQHLAGLGMQRQLGGIAPGLLPPSFFSRIGNEPKLFPAERKIETFYSKLKTEITEWLKIKL